MSGIPVLLTGPLNRNTNIFFFVKVCNASDDTKSVPSNWSLINVSMGKHRPLDKSVAIKK